jgi:hypothetical protein
MKLKYVKKITDRHGGEPFYYFRYRGKFIRLHGAFGSPTFMARYQQLPAGTKKLAEILPIVAKKGESQRLRSERFRLYCQRAAIGAHGRAKKAGVHCTIDERDIGQLLIDQNYCCAVSGLPLIAALDHPYRPSLDRIKPAEGYVPGNIRVVCMMVNQAMGHWGFKDLLTVVESIHRKHTQ